jgi:hypothetical protein
MSLTDRRRPRPTVSSPVSAAPTPSFGYTAPAYDFSSPTPSCDTSSSADCSF